MVTLKEFFSFKQNRFFWINLIAMVVVVIAAAWGTLAWLDQYTHHGESYVVPDVKNKSFEQAKTLLNGQHLEVEIVDSNYVKGLPAGIVLDQAPLGGMRVKQGRSLRQAAAKLKAMGFRLTEPVLVAGEQDWIYGIKYKGRSLKSNDKVPHEAVLTLCVGDTHLRDSLRTDSLQMQLNDAPEEAPQVDDSWF